MLVSSKDRFLYPQRCHMQKTIRCTAVVLTVSPGRGSDQRTHSRTRHTVCFHQGSCGYGSKHETRMKPCAVVWSGGWSRRSRCSCCQGRRHQQNFKTNSNQAEVFLGHHNISSLGEAEVTATTVGLVQLVRYFLLIQAPTSRFFGSVRKKRT